jgi:ABC-type nitrate/sulfonate/bicarbonate transport system substrate-binding protein
MRKIASQRIVFLLSFLGTALALCPRPAFTQALHKFTGGYAGVDVPQLPIWLAKETGIFKKNGLDVQLISFTGGPTAIAALISGDVPITQVSAPGVIRSNLSGADVILIAGVTPTLDFWLISRPDIKTPEQLKGGSIGIGRFGGVNDFTLDFLLPKLGLTVGKDVTIRQVGSVPVRLTALEAGQIHATLLSPPSSLMAQKIGLKVLADVAALGMVFQHTSVVTTRRFIKEQPDIVRRYIKSHVEAIHALKTDRAAGLKVLEKYLGGLKDREVLEKSYDRSVTDDKLPPKPYPSLEGIKTILDGMAKTDPKAKSAKPEDFVDLRFVKELDQNNFIDGLYKK